MRRRQRSHIRSNSTPVECPTGRLPERRNFARTQRPCLVELVVSLDFDKSLFIPNVFTPNNDGINDILYIRNLPENNLLTIANRWGRIIYEASDYQNDWDGEENADGVYFYNLVIPGAEQSYSGWIEIVRGNGL